MGVRCCRVGGRCLGIGTRKWTTLPGREIAAVASVVGREGMATGTETMLKGVEQMVVCLRKAGKSKERYTCGSKDKRVRFHLWTPLS
jgi:hypothetical protein